MLLKCCPRVPSRRAGRSNMHGWPLRSVREHFKDATPGGASEMRFGYHGVWSQSRNDPVVYVCHSTPYTCFDVLIGANGSAAPAAVFCCCAFPGCHDGRTEQRAVVYTIGSVCIAVLTGDKSVEHKTTQRESSRLWGGSGWCRRGGWGAWLCSLEDGAQVAKHVVRHRVSLRGREAGSGMRVLESCCCWEGHHTVLHHTSLCW